MGHRIVADPQEFRHVARMLDWMAEEMRLNGRSIYSLTWGQPDFEGQWAPWVQAIGAEAERRAQNLAQTNETYKEFLEKYADAFEAADLVEGRGYPGVAVAIRTMVEDGYDAERFPWWMVQRTRPPWIKLAVWNKLPWDDREAIWREMDGAWMGFANGTLKFKYGTADDLWNAFLVHLYMVGEGGEPPRLEVWERGAKAAGLSLEQYVSAVTGIKSERVHAWFAAVRTHELSLDDAVREMAAMAKAGESIEEHFGFSMEGNWSEEDKDDIVEAVLMVSHAMAGSTPEFDSATAVFRSVFDGIEFNLNDEGPERTWHCTGGGSAVACQPQARDRISPQTIAHELGHSFNARVVSHLNNGIRLMEGISNDQRTNFRDEVNDIRPYGELGTEEIVAEIDGELVHVAGRPPMGGYQRTDLGYASQETPWQQHSLRWGDNDPTGNTPGEDFADMFLGWAYDGFTDDPAGQARYDWMESHMAEWIEQGSGPIDLAWFRQAAP
ncbi:MAG TPA: hypothetical protein VJ123_08555 [Anaerolineales bacterium]|nr:hypothetical protein [Anaerolineales bacterium]